MSGRREKKKARTGHVTGDVPRSEVDVSGSNVDLLLRAIEAMEEEPQQVSTAQRGASVVVNNGVDNTVVVNNGADNTVVINNVAEDPTRKLLSDFDAKVDRAYRGVKTCDERTIKTMDRVRTLENKHTSMQDVIHNIDVRLTKVEAQKAAHGATMELVEGVKDAQARLEKEVEDLTSEALSQSERMKKAEDELNMQPQHGLDIEEQNKKIDALKNKLDALERVVSKLINPKPAQAQPAPPPGQDDRIRTIVRAGLRVMGGAEPPEGMTPLEEYIHTFCAHMAYKMQGAVRIQLVSLKNKKAGGFDLDVHWPEAVYIAGGQCFHSARNSVGFQGGSARHIDLPASIIMDEFTSVVYSWPALIRDTIVAEASKSLEARKDPKPAASASASGGRGT